MMWDCQVSWGVRDTWQEHAAARRRDSSYRVDVLGHPPVTRHAHSFPLLTPFPVEGTPDNHSNIACWRKVTWVASCSRGPSERQGLSPVAVIPVGGVERAEFVCYFIDVSRVSVDGLHGRRHVEAL